MGHEDGLRLIEDRNAARKLAKPRCGGHGLRAIPPCVQDTRRQALHLPPDMATLRDGGLAAD
jgi:hypothetical protein